MGIVPLPQKGSTRIRSPLQGVSRIRAAARAGFRSGLPEAFRAKAAAKELLRMRIPKSCFSLDFFNTVSTREIHVVSYR